MAMMTTHQWNILKIRKPGFLFIARTVNFLSKYPYFISWPRPFKSPQGQQPLMHPKAFISRHTHSVWYKNNLWNISRRSSLCLVLFTPHILFVASLVCVVKQMNAARKQTTRTHALEIIFQNLPVHKFIKEFIKHPAGTGLLCGGVELL
jgi:hypothetical protein